MSFSVFALSRKSALLAIGFAASLASSSAVHAALVNVSGEVTNPNATIGAGNTANFIGNGSFGWQTGNTSIDVINNGFTFTLDSGNGNGLNYGGSISGAGDVHFHMAPAWSGLANNAMLISGSTSNTYTGTSYVDYGHVQLQKSGGATAIAGNVIIGGQGNNDRLSLGASNQIADTSIISFTGSSTATFNVNGFAEAVNVVQVTSNAVLDTGAGGALSTKALNNNGSWLAPGVYDSGDFGFITGSGSVTVLGGASVAPGNSIGLNFAGANNNPGGRKAIGANTAAGAPTFIQTNWNNTLGTQQVGTPSSANDTINNLVDSNGFITTLDVNFTAAQTWGHNWGSNPTGDQQLNGNGITDGTPTVNVSQIPFSQYDVVLYIGNYDQRNATVTLTEEDGSITQRFVTMPIWGNFVGYDQVSDGATSAALRDMGNYIVFSGVTGSSFSVSASTGGINAIQIVNSAIAVPEPAALALLALSAFALPRRTRRA